MTLDTFRTRVLTAQNLALTSATLYLFSLFTPAYVLHLSPGKDDLMPGFGALALGWIVIGRTYAWFANPFIFLAFISHVAKNRAATLVFSVLALIAAISFLFLKALPAGTSDFERPFSIHIGYILWVASMLVLLFSTMVWPAPEVAQPLEQAPQSDA